MLIGLTGGIGSGKSTIAAELRRRGYAVYDSDIEAKRIITYNPAVRSQIEYLFGSDVFSADNHYRTDVVSQAVFQQPALLQRLNHIVHPAVCFDVRHWAKTFEQDAQTQTDNDMRGICFVESAILFESGLAEECRLTVEITAPQETRIQRTMQRDNATREQVIKRIHAQMTEQERTGKADIIVNNDGLTPIPKLVTDMFYNIKTSLV